MFAAYDGDGKDLKMVGVQTNGVHQAKYKTNPGRGFTLDDVKQAWESPTADVGTHYRIKDISSVCSTGI